MSFGTPNGRLFLAAESASVSMGRKALDDGADPNALAHNFETAMSLCIGARFSPERDRLEFIEMLISAGADVNLMGSKMMTPLMEAAKNGDMACSRLLISRGASISEVNAKGQSCLHFALIYGESRFKDLEFAKLFLDAGADPNLADLMGQTPLSLSKGFRSNEVFLFFSAATESVELGHEARKGKVRVKGKL